MRFHRPGLLTLHIREKKTELRTPAIMGILNVTPDSFSDGGRFLSVPAALKQAEQLVKDGAAIIDVGGESSRPGAQVVPDQDEIRRVLPVIQMIKRDFPVLVSVDTCKEAVARASVEEAGADIVNDIYSLNYSTGMAGLIARLQVPVILMHMKGIPRNMQDSPYYTDVIAEIRDFFVQHIEKASLAGIRPDRIILDPGIGFGKRVEDNLAIVKKLDRFSDLSKPLLLGISRKSFLGKITGASVPDQRETETTCAQVIALLNRTAILRVHDVGNARKTIQILNAFAGEVNR